MKTCNRCGLTWDSDVGLCGRCGYTENAPSSVQSTSLLARDHEELIRRFCAYRDALDYCLAVLKHHHMTKRGIPTLVKKTEQIKRKPNAGSEALT